MRRLPGQNLRLPRGFSYKQAAIEARREIIANRLERNRSMRDNYRPTDQVNVQDLHRADLDSIVERDPRYPVIDQYIAELKQEGAELRKQLVSMRLSVQGDSQHRGSNRYDRHKEMISGIRTEAEYLRSVRKHA